MHRSTIRAGSLAFLLPLAALAQQSAPQVHVRGDVLDLRGDALEVRTRAGEVVHLLLGAKAGVAQVERADPGAISEGAFVGTTAVTQPDGTLRAVEVHVFPQSMRGTGEGHRPWDLQPGASMTNATVSGTGSGAADDPAPSSMTNATVAKSTRAGGERTLTLRYAGGQQTVHVPADTPIVRLEPGDRSLLVAGAHVFVIAVRQADGPLVAQRVTVGRGGVVPPM